MIVTKSRWSGLGHSRTVLANLIEVIREQGQAAQEAKKDGYEAEQFAAVK